MTAVAKKPEKAPKKGASRKAEAEAEAVAVETAPRQNRPIPVPRLKAVYAKDLRPKLMKDLGLENINQTPRLVKIVLNSGLGEGTKEFKVIEEMSKDIATITGQKPILRRAAKDVSAFNVRAGNPIGLMVTLRNKRMYEFLDRFINVTLPRVRDFRGIPAKGFDGRGNLTIGVREHTVFAEINIEKIFRVKGLNVTFVTTAGRDDHARSLLAAFGMPFSDSGS